MSSLSCAGPDTSREPQPVTREKCSLADFDWLLAVVRWYCLQYMIYGAATKTSLWYLWSPMSWKWRLFTFKLKFGPFQKGFCLWCASHFQYCSANSSWVFLLLFLFQSKAYFYLLISLWLWLLFYFIFLGCPWFKKKKRPMSTLILCKSGSELGLYNTRATLDCQSSYLYSTNSQQALPQDALYFKA